MPLKHIIKLTIHVLFWIFYVLILFVFNQSYGDDQNIIWYEKIEVGFLVLVLGLAYINNLILLPYFFRKSQYFYYTLVTVALVFFTTYLHCYYVCYGSILECFVNNLWFIALPFVFLSFIWVVLEFFKKQKELEKAHHDKVQLELKFLKAQINPHVLFNSLNTIYAKAVDENEAVAELILMLSENLKYVLNQSEETLVSLEQDIAFIENYLKFQELRTQGVNNIVYTKEIDSYDYFIAPLLLIDFIENAFKHALYKENERCDIFINIKIRNGILLFTCKNDFDENLRSNNNGGAHIGLENLQQRLRLLYKNKYKLHTEKNNGVFSVELNIDLR